MAGPYNPAVKNQAWQTRVSLNDMTAVGSFKANPTLAAGDFKVDIDGAGFNNFTNLPSVSPAAGVAVLLNMTAAEFNGDVITLVGIDQTSPKEWADFRLTIHTTTAALPANVTQWNGGAVPAPNVTGVPLVDNKYLLGTLYSTPTVAGIPNVNAKTWNDLTTVALPLVPTAAGRTLDVSATGEAGLDWANIGSPTTVVGLSGTTIKTATDVTALLPTALATDGSIKASVQSFLGTAFTEGAAGRIAAAFKQFFNIATPAATMDHGILVDTVTTATTATNLTNAPTNGDFTTAMKTSLNAATPVATLGSAYDFAKGTVAMTEAYAANSATITPAQALHMIWSLLRGRALASTTLTATKLDNSTTAMTFTLDSATVPTTQVRAS